MSISFAVIYNGWKQIVLNYSSSIGNKRSARKLALGVAKSAAQYASRAVGMHGSGCINYYIIQPCVIIIIIWRIKSG
jgi:hypothetical protein